LAAVFLTTARAWPRGRDPGVARSRPGDLAAVGQRLAGLRIEPGAQRWPRRDPRDGTRPPGACQSRRQVDRLRLRLGTGPVEVGTWAGEEGIRGRKALMFPGAEPIPPASGGSASVSPGAMASCWLPTRGAGGVVSATAKVRLRPAFFARYRAESAAASMSVTVRRVPLSRVATPIDTV